MPGAVVIVGDAEPAGAEVLGVTDGAAVRLFRPGTGEVLDGAAVDGTGDSVAVGAGAGAGVVLVAGAGVRTRSGGGRSRR